MIIPNTQAARIQFLIEAFRQESSQYRNIEIPVCLNEQEKLLQSLMNVRPPGPLPQVVLQVQADYLQARTRQKGIVTLDQIPVIQDNISLWQGDITRLHCDAIVNAANSQMLGCFIPLHTCIDNVIHTFSGVELRNECHRQMEILRAERGFDYEQPTAIPLLTSGYNLPAKRVIHVVGPIVSGPLTESLKQDLSDCYRHSLDLCLEHGITSIAFCCISTGVYRFPNEEAALIATSTVKDWVKSHRDCLERIIFNVFTDKDRMIYEQLLHEAT